MRSGKGVRPIPSRISRGSAELVILGLLSREPLYGFQIAKRVAEDTGGLLSFTLASLYPMLYELERRGWIKGRWEANSAGRDRRFYSLTPVGKRRLAPLRRDWQTLFLALERLADLRRA